MADKPEFPQMGPAIIAEAMAWRAVARNVHGLLLLLRAKPGTAIMDVERLRTQMIGSIADMLANAGALNQGVGVEKAVIAGLQKAIENAKGGEPPDGEEEPN